MGDLPRNLDEVAERQKDIQYASKQRFNIERVREIGELQARADRSLLDKLPAKLKTDPEARKLAAPV